MATLVALAAFVVAPGGGGAALAQPADDDPEAPFAATFTRYSGFDRYATAAVVSRRGFPVGADRVFVATGTTFPDALAAGAVAGREAAPILLTPPTELPDSTALELARLDPDEVVVMGGSAAVSDGVLATIEDVTGVTPLRVGGTDRFHTAALLSEREFDPGVPAVFVATGGNFPDALASGPLAGHRGAPILLVTAGELPARTAAELDRLDPDEVVVLGGTAAVGQEVFDRIEGASGANARRVAGTDRFATAVEISKELPVEGEAAFLATGSNFPDALGGGPAAAVRSGPLLLTPFDCVPDLVNDELERRDPDRVAVLGGTAVVSDRAAAGIPCGVEGDLPAVSFTVDPALDAIEGDAPARSGTSGRRVLEAVRDAKGHQLDFAANELIAVADGPELDGILERTGGRVVETVSTGPGIHRILVTAPSITDGSELSALVRHSDLRSRGAHVVSSAGALGLLTLAAREVAAGHVVTVNYRMFGDEYLDRDLADAPSGPNAPGAYTYDPNPVTWPWLRNVTDPGSRFPDWGVPEAWRALDLAGRTIPSSSSRIRILVVDGGFPADIGTNPNFDLTGHVVTAGLAAGENTGSCSGGGSCPWHGTWVSQVAAGNADNGIGTAGVGHQVANVVPFQWNGDVIDTLVNLVGAATSGASIVNMSFSVPVPAGLYFLLIPMEILVISSHLGGVSFVASAGNAGLNVDATDCFVVCWEEAVIAPCELEATVCVGGTDYQYYWRDPDSNYGTDSPTGATVDIFAPWDAYKAGDPDNDSPQAFITGGTSFSAPFVSGLLAMIRAADDSVAAIGAEEHLFRSAIKHGDKWYVDAEVAVTRALGGQVPPRTLRMTSPTEGQTFRRGQNLPLEITLVGGPPATITWYIDGTEVGTGTTTAFNVNRSSLSLGEHVVRAEYRAGVYRRDFQRTITVENTPPTGSITEPDFGHDVCQSCNVNLRATSFDPDESDGDLDGGQLVWTVDGQPGTLATGASATVTGADIGPPGSYGLRLTGTDAQGAEFVDTVTVDTTSDPADVEPNVSITSPTDGDSQTVEATDGNGSYVQVTLQGEYSDPDPDGSTMSIQWTITGGADQPDPVFVSGSSTTNPAQVRLYNNTGSDITYAITLTVTESDGPSNTDTVGFTVVGFG